jgi:hypothetical protein
MLRIFRYGAFSSSAAQIARFSHSLNLAGFFMPEIIVRIDTVNCGSEPAREDGLTFDIDID